MEKQRDLKAVLFDFDGTLVHLPTNYPRMRDRLKKAFAQFNIHSDFHPLMESIELTLCELGEKAPPEVGRQIKEKAFAIIEEEELDAVENAQMADGAREVLLSLQNRCMAIAIVSRNGRNCIEKCFSKFNLPQSDLIVAREDVNKLKPHPEHFGVALERLGLEPAQVIIIGDSYHDTDGGKELGIETILVIPENIEPKDVTRGAYKISSLSEKGSILDLAISR
ncbi:HAD family hydrolase [Chloroflexota bacterium]